MAARIVFACLLLILAGCRAPVSSPTESTKPPLPELSVGGESLPYALGSYCWREGQTGLCGDSIPPPDLLKFRAIPLVAVKPGALVSVRFGLQPSELSATIHGGGGSLPVAGGKLKLPRQSGTQIIILFARWDRGDASYVFHVDVK